MKIVKIDGEMAVQMFQYALYLRLRQHDGAEVALDVPKHWIAEQFALSGYTLASPEQLAPYRSGLMGRLRGIFKSTDKDSGIVTDEFGTFCRDVLDLGQGLLVGSWASPRYFEPVAQEVAEAFILAPEKLSEKARTVIDQMATADAETVALHIHKPLSADNTCTTDYYNWAIANISSYIPDAKFFVFTDDEALVRDRLFLPEGSTFVSTKGLSELDLMQILLRASHNISANTLTSWWVSWLNPNPDKITIVPKRWSTGEQPRDLIPIYWTAIPTT